MHSEEVMSTSLFSVAGVLTLVLAANLASADEASDRARAAALFLDGQRLLATEDYAAACPKLAESQALHPAQETEFVLGLCYQKASQAAFNLAHDLAPPLEPREGAVSLPVLASPPQPDAQEPGHAQRVVGITVGGVGIAGLIVGVTTAVMAKSAWDNAVSRCGASGCTPPNGSQLATARSLAAASSISLLAGGAAIGTGVILFFTAPQAKTSVRTGVGLGLAAEGTGLAVAGSF
jgi:hypothetical protein